MKRICYIIVPACIAVLTSCGGAENKVDTQDTIKNTATDTVQHDPIEKAPENPAPAPKTTTTESPAETPASTPKNNILSNIDKYVVSTASGDLVTVENTLTDITFERAYVEVSELNDAGQPAKTNFYTIVNLEPGGKKSFKIPSNNGKLSIKIVKAKSENLTGGEMVLTGSHYTPK